MAKDLSISCCVCALRLCVIFGRNEVGALHIYEVFEIVHAMTIG